MNIVASTDYEGLKISSSEWRIDKMDKAWKKWAIEFPNIEYLKSDDRLVFHYVPYH